MVPDVVVELDTLPLTENGKVDRSALPAPAENYQKDGYVYEEPANEIEKEIADIVCALLGLEKVGRFDDFFELGGHSLLATELASKIQESYSIDMEVTSIFTQPTVKELAELVIETQIKEVDEAGIRNIIENFNDMDERELEKILSIAEE
jgi:acyl carrier protein